MSSDVRVSVFGMGYVGAVSATCLAAAGHRVIGVDPDRNKVELIGSGRSPIVETGLQELLAKAVADGKLEATTSAAEAIGASDLTLVCVGTPSRLNGDLDLSYVRRVCEQIGQALAAKDAFHIVVMRSTMLPGTMRDVVIPTLQAASGKRPGVDFGVAVNPEFMREGSAIHDYRHPPKTVVGALDERSAQAVASLYSAIDAPFVSTSIDVAEMVKYVDNCWHALKVGFANEIGNLCKAVGVDSHGVMDIFCRDTKLNLSPYYLRPGFAFGGSCLPKDLRALNQKAKSLDIAVPILGAILPSNQLQIDRGVAMVTATGAKRIGVLGFSFKAGTDDLRESPVLELIERLIGKGFDLRVFDANVNLSKLTGANRDFLYNTLPHVNRVMVESMDEVLEHAEVLVIGNGSAEFAGIAARLRDDQRVVDLVRTVDGAALGERYAGICW